MTNLFRRALTTVPKFTYMVNSKIDTMSEFSKKVFVPLKEGSRQLEIFTKNQEIQTDYSKCIVLTIKLIKETSKVDVDFQADFSKAKNIKDIFSDIEILRAFLQNIISNEDPESQKLYKLFDYWNGFWKRSLEIEKILNISIDTKKISNSYSFEREINLLYITLFKKKFIKETRKLLKLNNMFVNGSKEINFQKDKVSSSPISLNNITEESFDITGNIVHLYRLTHIMNVQITDIKQGENGMKEIYFKQPSEEYVPLCVYTLFTKKREARQNLNTYDSKIVEESKTLDEYMENP